jgi:phage terminase large subunit-like protein
LTITTAGLNDPTTACYREYHYAKQVKENTITDTQYFAEIHETPENADPNDERNWFLSNPSLGATMDLDTFRKEWETAKQTKATELEFRRLKLNQFTSTLTGWLNLNTFDQCKQPFPTLQGLPAIIGIDIGITDLTGISTIIPFGDKYYLYSHGFVSKEAGKKRREGGEYRYETFIKEGSLTYYKDDEEFTIALFDYIQLQAKKFQVKEIIFDKWQALALQQKLLKQGYTVYDFRQNHNQYDEPCKSLESLLVQQRFIHDGSELLRWCASNATLETDKNGKVMPKKDKTAQAKIDLLTSAIMALSRATQYAINKQIPKSIYESRGF